LVGLEGCLGLGGCGIAVALGLQNLGELGTQSRRRARLGQPRPELGFGLRSLAKSQLQASQILRGLEEVWLGGERPPVSILGPSGLTHAFLAETQVVGRQREMRIGLERVAETI